MTIISRVETCTDVDVEGELDLLNERYTLEFVQDFLFQRSPDESDMTPLQVIEDDTYIQPGHCILREKILAVGS